MRLASIVAATFILTISTATASGLGEQFKAIGPWSVLKNQDPMTDAVSCIAIYKGNSQVQVTIDSLAIGLRGRGGVSGYTIRLDDRPAGSMTLASKTERNVGAAVIGGQEFQSLLRAKRVRFQALTALSSLVNEDLDFSQIQAVLSFLKGPSCGA